MKINTYSETKLKEKFNCCFKSRSHLHFNKFRFKLFFVVCFTAGLIFALQKVLTNVFATANSSITIDTDEDFEGGSLVSTSIFGSGSEAIVQLSGMAGPDGTQYRREVEITNNSGSTLTDYQVSFTLDTASLISDNKMNANCSDIRFLDSDDSTGINNYWVENCDSDGDSSTKIWVKVPSIPESGKTIYLYYGKRGISSKSSVTNTFIREISGLIGAWSLNETSGNSVNDTSGNSNSGTAIGTKISDGKFDKTRVYNGTSSDYVHIPNKSILNPGSNPFSTVLWFKADSTGSLNASILYNKENLYELSAGGGYVTYAWFPHWNWDGGTSFSINVGEWYQVAVVYDKSNQYLYKNGSQVYSRAQTGDMGSNTERLAFATRGSSGGGNSPFKGSIDEIRFYNKALSSSEISDLYNNYGYSTPNYPGKELVRKWAYFSGRTTGEEGVSASVADSEIIALPPSGTWESSVDNNVIDIVWNGGWGDGTDDSIAFSAKVSNIESGNSITFFMRVAESVSALSSASYTELGTIESGETFIRTKEQLDSFNLGVGSNRYVQVKAVFSQTNGINPQLDNITINYLSDDSPPDENASEVSMLKSKGGRVLEKNDWTNNPSPYFSWIGGSDSQSGIKGYCLYLGTDPDGDPATSKGILGTSPVSTDGTTCQFIVSGTAIDFSMTSYKGDPWLTSSNELYYFNVKAIDNTGHVFTGTPSKFQFLFDDVPPINVSYISCASGGFSNVVDMNFSWPTSGSIASSDSNSGLLGWQYRINSTSGAWVGTTNEPNLGVDYIPIGESSRTLSEAQDGESIILGNNIVYFRAVDKAGNASSDSTIRTCNLSYGGKAPAFAGTDVVTVNPQTNTSNEFSLSWPEAIPANGQSIAHYYYMINVSPPQTLYTLQSNASTYIDNGNLRTVSSVALPNVNKGANTIYVVAVDDSETPNYSPSNYIMGTFTLDSTNPDNVTNLVASDSSIKSQSQWNVTLTWIAPVYQGAGNLTYLIYRSTDGSNFSQVGSTSGLSYVDNTPSSTIYYYKIYTRDGANAQSSGTNSVSIIPTGKWTVAPDLDSGPTVSNITTKRATIIWSTSRAADSKVQYGTTNGNYGSVEPSSSSQVTSHSIQLVGLKPSTTYYYKAKWTDEDGNTGTSGEKSFSTLPSPTVKNVSAKGITLSSAIIEFTSKNASKVKVYYGNTTSFGGAKEISTSTDETTYTVELTGLSDNTKYYYKINTFDDEDDEYEGTILDFTTPPRPKISNVRIQQVVNTAQPTVLITWSTNTDVSSIVTYYPKSNPSDVRDEVNVTLTKGEHKMVLRGLMPQTDYILTVKGRDKIGNEATSDTQLFTTATDTRPPQISDFRVEGSVNPTSAGSRESSAQLIVSWNTDEPGTSQVEFGEGTGADYSSKTQEDSNLTLNHLVVISGFTPSKVYHLRAISKDKAGNEGLSIDMVTITPKATDNALDLVITNLQEAFGFLGGLKN